MSQESLFTSAFVYLLAAVISVPVAKRLGLSAVLGYLVAGIVIGPFVLKLVGEEGQDVMHFAEFGVVMMLFVVGLELRPSLLWRLRGPIIGLGGAQVAVTTLVVMGIGLACGLIWQMALAVGMALALSSTAIVLQSLEEKGLSKTAGGRSAFSVLLFQDIAVIPMLALFPLLATLSVTGGGDEHSGEATGFAAWVAHQPGWAKTLLVLGAVGAIILGGRFLFQPILGMVARTRVREAFVALALLLVIGIALLMTSLGVSAALGTFLAGVVLADSSYRHELESDIEPFKGLLLGVFFIAVGASIDFSLIASQPMTIFGVVAGLMVLKAVILLVLGKVAKLAMDQRLLFGLSLAQGGEFAFVLFGFGISAGVLDGQLAQILIAAVALTMGLTPVVMLFEERVLRSRFGTRETEARPDDAMQEDAPVILAGVGRFGNFVARMLRAQGIETTVIDHDSDHIDFLRRLGIQAFYGDACRHDLLHAAGAHTAKLLIIALDNEEKIKELIELVRKHFPHLQILSRALSRTHQYDLISEKVDFSIHDQSGSAIRLTENALTRLGFRAHRAARIARAFEKHDNAAVEKVAAVHKDEAAYIGRVRESLAEVQRQFGEDQQQHEMNVDKAWDTSRLREDTLGDDDSDIVPARDGG